MRNQVKKLAYGLLTASLLGCGVTSEVATHHPGATLSSPAYTEPTSEPLAPAPRRPVVGQAAGSHSAVSPPPLAAATASRRSDASLAVYPAKTLHPDSTAAAPALGAANRRIQAGRILDEAGQPLVGATVLVRGTSRGTSSDANGDYSLPVPLGTNTFVFAYSGYQDEVAQSPDGQPLTVTLLPVPGLPIVAPEPKQKPRLLKAHLRKAKRQ